MITVKSSVMDQSTSKLPYVCNLISLQLTTLKKDVVRQLNLNYYCESMGAYPVLSNKDYRAKEKVSLSTLEKSPR